MSIKWDIDKSSSGEAVKLLQIMQSGQPVSSSCIATLMKDDEVIALYGGLNDVKDEDIIKHAKSYFGIGNGLILHSDITNTSYEI